MQVDIVRKSIESGVNSKKIKNLAGHALSSEHYSGSNPSFGNGTRTALSTLDYIKQLCGDPKWMKRISGAKWIDYLTGELGGILITAAGTGFVAPFPIAFNPFVKAKPGATEEEKAEVRRTKEYSAWRQPISAIIAIITQAGVQPLINKFVDAQTNNPDYAKNYWLFLDRREVNSKSYLENQFKKEVKKEIKDKNITFDSRKEKNAYIKSEVAKRVEAKHAQQLENMAKYLEEHGQIKIGDRFVDNKTIADLINKQIDSYAAGTEKLKIHDFSNGELRGKDFYLVRADQLITNEAELRNILDQSKLPQGETELLDYLKQAIKDTDKSDVRQILQEIVDKDDHKVRLSRCQRTLDRIDCIKNLCGDHFDMNTYAKVMRDRNDEIDGLIKGLKKLKIEDPANASPSQVQRTLAALIEKCGFDPKNAKLSSLLSDSKVFSSVPEKLQKKIYKDLVDGYQALVNTRCKAVNQWIKIIIGALITMPASCTILNWIYPRFMEIFFPALAGVKKENNPNGGNK